MDILHEVGAALSRAFHPVRPGELLVAGAIAPAAAPRLGVTSGAFSYGDLIPTHCSRDGGNASPPLSWRGVPPATREIVVLCEAPNALAPRPIAHWVLHGISADVRAIPERSSAIGIAGRNDNGTNGYVGPYPGPGRGVHRYHYQVFALAADLHLSRHATRDDVAEAMRGQILAWGEIVATFHAHAVHRHVIM